MCVQRSIATADSLFWLFRPGWASSVQCSKPLLCAVCCVLTQFCDDPAAASMVDHVSIPKLCAKTVVINSICSCYMKYPKYSVHTYYISMTLNYHFPCRKNDRMQIITNLHFLLICLVKVESFVIVVALIKAGVFFSSVFGDHCGPCFHFLLSLGWMASWLLPLPLPQLYAELATLPWLHLGTGLDSSAVPCTGSGLERTWACYRSDSSTLSFQQMW